MKVNKRRPLANLLKTLAPVARKTLLHYYAPNCCIATCAALAKVFALYGYKATPLPVEVHIFNPAMAKVILAGQQPVVRDPAWRRWMDLTGAYSIGIAPASRHLSAARGIDAFGGHLVLLVKGMMIDASVQQAERPAFKIVLPDMVAIPFPQTLLRGGALSLRDANGMLMVYRRITDYSFLTAPDWRDTRGNRRQVVQDLVDAIEGRMP